MAIEITVPTLGESVADATVARWIKKTGDAVKTDEPVVELETDKVTLEVPAPAAGTLGEILAAENFKDGKKKSKSRPGRVKRSGASCNGSVTDLRRKAKNASGEKAKMYHWCANMKSGRKK